MSFRPGGSLTQSVEYLPFKQRVARSNRARPTTYFRGYAVEAWPLFSCAPKAPAKTSRGPVRRVFFPFRRGAVSAEQWGRRGGAGEPGRELVRNAGLKAAEPTEEENRAGKERRAGKEYATLHGGNPHGGQTEAERQTEEEKQFPARGGRLRDSGGDGRFSRNRRAFYPFFIPRTGENAVSEGGKIFFARTVQSKVDFFHVA